MLILKKLKSVALETRGAARPRRAFGIVGAMALATLLSGCGMSKPGSSEIENALNTSYRCTPFVVKDIKKVDGAPVSDNAYDVSFRYQVEFKGGEQGAVDYFTKVNVLSKAYQAARREGSTPDDSVREIAWGRSAKISAELDLIRFGGCQSPRQAGPLHEEVALVQQHLHTLVENRLNKDAGPVALPYGATVFGVARAGKAESGWIIHESRYPKIEQVMDTDPQRLER